MPDTLLVGLAVQGRYELGQTAVFDKVTIVPLDAAFDFEPLGYEMAATNTAGIGSRPYPPLHVKARVAVDAADAVAAGGSGLGVKNRNWFWSDLTAGDVDLAGTTQLLWNNENRNFAGARLLYEFHAAARVYIAWDTRLVKGGSDNLEGTVDNGWFDFNNDKGTWNKQGWLRLTARSDNTTPLAEEIRTSGDDNFARGGVWAKDVAAGDVLEFEATGYSAGRSPYVVFVDAGQTCEKGGALQNLDYTAADDLGIVVVRSGGFTPAVVDGRLRITQDGIDSSGTAVWYGVPADPGAGGVPLIAEGFVAEFDAFMAHSGQANADFNPADALGLVVVATGENDGLASAIWPWAPGLDVASLCGDGGGSLGYHGGTMMERTEGHPNFMIEMDTWYGSSDAVNEPYGYGSTDFDGYYHFGLNVAGQANSVQTSADLGIPREAIPDLFNAAGVHVEVMYKPTGEITVWASGFSRADGAPIPRTLMLSKAIQPLTAGDMVIGFVGGTGGAVETAEIDNFVVSTVCSERPDTVSIAGPDAANQGSTAAYAANFAGADLGASVAYTWEVVTGSATIASPAAATTDVTFHSPDGVVLKVTADDGACGAVSATHAVTLTPLTCGIASVTGQVDPLTRTVDLAVTPEGTNGCSCAQIVVRQEGTELYRGALADLPPLDLPAGCYGPTALTYEVSCVGPQGESAPASCTVTCPPSPPCSISVTCSVPTRADRKVTLTVTAGSESGCSCNDIVVRQAGVEVYRGPIAALGELPLPEDCCNLATLEYVVACIGNDGSEGAVASCTVTCPFCEQPFIRGDANADGQPNISDIEAILFFLFLGATSFPCEKAADVNDDGFLDISDPIRLLNYLFLGSGPIPQPLEACGIDPTADLVPCTSFPACP